MAAVCSCLSLFMSALSEVMSHLLDQYNNNYDIAYDITLVRQCGVKLTNIGTIFSRNMAFAKFSF